MLKCFHVLQVLQWLIVHADTIQSLLRCRELSLGGLQELSLLTGIISKTALPGTKINTCFLFTSIVNMFSKHFHVWIFNGSILFFMDQLVFQVFLKWVERSTVLLVWSSRVTYTDSRFDSHSFIYWLYRCTCVVLFPYLSVCIQLLLIYLSFLTNKAPLFVIAWTIGWKWQGQVVEAGRNGSTWRFPRWARRNGGGSATGRSNVAVLIKTCFSGLKCCEVLSDVIYCQWPYRCSSLCQVCANLMEYCQTLLLQSSTQAQFSICLFSPSASEPSGRDGGRTGQSDCTHTVNGGRILTRH